MDAGLQNKELVAMIGGTENTVINWEVRGDEIFGKKSQ